MLNIFIASFEEFRNDSSPELKLELVKRADCCYLNESQTHLLLFVSFFILDKVTGPRGQGSVRCEKFIYLFGLMNRVN